MKMKKPTNTSTNQKKKQIFKSNTKLIKTRENKLENNYP
jgi:hypothetical protein